MHAFLGGDQLLGLAGESLLRDAQDLVDVGAALGVGELELATRLDLLQAAVEIGVVLRGGLELASPGGRCVTPRSCALLLELRERSSVCVARPATPSASWATVVSSSARVTVELAGEPRRLGLRRRDLVLGVGEALRALLELARAPSSTCCWAESSTLATRWPMVASFAASSSACRASMRDELRLELLAGDPDLLLEIGLALDELGPMATR